MKSSPAIAAIALLLLGGSTLHGCAQVATATQKPTAALGKLLLSPEDEKAIGDQLAAQVRQQEKILDDQEVQRYVGEVGARIVAAVPKDQQRFPFDFTVIDSPDTVNAFALPGGHLFVYSGLIAAADNEAELAAVLGHEVAHVTLGHASQQLAAQVGTQTLAGLAVGTYPGLITELAAAIAAQGYMAAYSRMDERQADETGLGYLAGANYTPQAMASFFQKLQSMDRSDHNAVAAFFASHPSPKDRVAEIETLIRERGYSGGRTSVVGGFQPIRNRLGGGQEKAPAPSDAEGQPNPNQLDGGQ